jgi:PHD/YefM family antitoxin component YafN of YafNO toxin-antitoxin module
MNELEMNASYSRKNLYKLVDDTFERDGTIRIIKDSQTKVVLMSLKKYKELIKPIKKEVL